MLGYVLDHLAGILVQQRIVLHDKERVVVLVKDRHELEDCESSTYIQFGDVAVQLSEDSGVIPTDEEDFVPLQIKVVVDGIYQKLRRGNQDVECVLDQRDGWV